MDAVASMDSSVAAYFPDDLAAKMVRMVAAAASFDGHLVDRVDEAYLKRQKMKSVIVTVATQISLKTCTLWWHSWIITEHSWW